MKNPQSYRLTAASEDLAVNVYQVTKQFPRDERFGITAQIRRSAVSVGSNFVEGLGRQGDRALMPFLHNALGSANELEFQLRVARRLQLGAIPDLDRLLAETISVAKQVAALISTIRSELGS